MQWVELSVIINKESAVEAISSVFYGMGVGGVVVEDPEMARRCIARGEWDFYELPSGFLERDYVVVTAYFAEPGPDLLEVKAAMTDTLADYDVEFELVSGRVDENDWANFWKTFYHTVRVGEHLVVKPTWERYEAKPGDLLIELDPEMAFGTGTHSTTRFCMQLLEKHLRPGMKVWDIGTGSGILSIAAAKLGAGPITALDIDQVAVQTAQANVEQNHLSERVKVMEMDFLTQTPDTEKPDILVANIIAVVIEQMAEKVWSVLPDDGMFLISGIIVPQWADLLEKLQSWFELVELLEDDSWVGALLQKKGD